MDRPMNKMLRYWTNVQAGPNGEENLRFTVETATGEPVVLIIQDGQTLDTLVRLIIPGLGATDLGQALSMAGAMRLTEEMGGLGG